MANFSAPLKKQLDKINFARFLEEERRYEDAFIVFKKAYEETDPPLTYEDIIDVAIKFFHY